MHRRPRPAAVVLAVLAVPGLALTGCGFLQDVTDGEDPVAVAPVAPTPRPAPPTPRPLGSFAVDDDRDLPGAPFRGRVQVSALPVADGLPPLPGFGADCGLDPAATRYVAVDVSFVNRSGSVATLAATIGVTGDRAAEVGVFLESSQDVRYCADGEARPATDHFALAAGVGQQLTTTAYLVSTAAGDPFTGLTVELGDLQNTAYSSPELVTVGTWTPSGATGSCPDATDRVCLSLS